jgi:hypothetical protein
MVLAKAVMVGAVFAISAICAANAADPAYPAATGQTQAAPTNPAIPYSYTRLPGPKAGPSNWIPSTHPDQTMPSSGGYRTVPYSQNGAGL